LKTLRLT